MITEQEITDVRNVIMKKRLNPLYRPSPSERSSIDAVLDADVETLALQYGLSAESCQFNRQIKYKTEE